MKKVFNLLYFEYRQTILFTMFGLYTFLGITKLSNFNNLFYWETFANIIVASIALVLFIYLIVDFFNRKFKLTWYLIFGVICASVVIFTAKSAMLCFFIAFLYVFKDSNFNKIAKVSALSIFIAVGVVVLGSLIGLIETSIIMRENISRQTLGFQSATSVNELLMLGILAYNFYRKEKITWMELLLELIAVSVGFYFTNTRLGFLLTFVCKYFKS